MAEKKLALPANAKDPGKDTSKDPAKDDGKAKGRMSLSQNAIGFVVAGLIAAGVGAFQGLQAKAPDEAPKPGGVQSPVRSGEERKFAPIVEMGTLDVAPVVTNLASPQDIWVRVEGVLLFEGKTLPHGEALAGLIAGDILAFMRTQTLAQIQGVAGLQHLRQDLNERVATRSEGHVREFIIKSLVVQ